MPRSSYDIAREISIFLASNDIFDFVSLGSDQKDNEPEPELECDPGEDVEGDTSVDLIVYPVGSVEEEGQNEIDIYFQYAVECGKVTREGKLKIYEGLKMIADIEKEIYGLKFFNRYNGQIIENEVLPVDNFPYFLGYTMIRYSFPITIK